MKKITFFLIILSLMVGTTFAKVSINPTNLFNEPILEKLIKSSDFISFYDAMKVFSEKVVVSKSGTLFQKYLSQKLTPTEEIQFVQNMGFTSITQLNERYSKIKLLAEEVGKQIPELASYQPEERKIILKKALEEVYKKNPSKVFSVTIGDCWMTWVTCNFACVWCCFENQFLTCQGICDLVFLFCWALAD